MRVRPQQVDVSNDTLTRVVPVDADHVADNVGVGREEARNAEARVAPLDLQPAGREALRQVRECCLTVVRDVLAQIKAHVASTRSKEECRRVARVEARLAYSGRIKLGDHGRVVRSLARDACHIAVDPCKLAQRAVEREKLRVDEGKDS